MTSPERTGGLCRWCWTRPAPPGWPTCTPCFFQPDRFRPRWSDSTPESEWWERARTRWPDLDITPTIMKEAA